MKLETILNAFELCAGRLSAIEAKFGSDVIGNPAYWKRDRQYRAFRARILRMDAEKDKRIKEMQDIYTLERLLNNEEEQDD